MRMPGLEHVAPRIRAAHVAMQDNPELLPAADTPAAGPGGVPDGSPRQASRPSGSLASKTDRPALPALIAVLAAVAFVLARLQTWAKGSIGAFILVGRNFSVP